MRVALYARVSTDKKGQDPLNQIHQLRAFAKKQGWTVYREYVDRATGKTGDRDEFNAMRDDAGQHKFDVLLFWSLDRLTREGTFKTLTYLRSLTDNGVKFKSYTEQYLDTLGVFGEAIAGLLGALAQQEARRISERTKAGLEKARRAGKTLGRPKLELPVAKLRQLQKTHKSIGAMARELACSRTAIRTALEGI
jgi:DNA invertase Pin-like site-specific DNA recombinase